MADEGVAGALRGLAAISAARPRSPAAGGVHYLWTHGWYLSSTRELVGEELRPVSSRLEEVGRERWVAPDGSGRVEEFCDGRPSEISGVYGPGHFESASWSAADVDALVAEALGEQRSPLRVLADLWSAAPVPPAVQARTLDALAALGAATWGRVTDRLGRDGLAVATEDTVLETAYRYVVVLSDTGDLLAAEEVALEAAGWLPAEAPCTVSYTAFITSALVARVGMRPAAAW